MERRRSTVEEGRHLKPFDAGGFLRRRLSMIGVFGTAAFAVLLPVLLPFSAPVYETDGLLLINPAKETTLTGRERETIPGDIGDYTRTLVNRLTGPDILRAAIQRVPAGARPPFVPDASDMEQNIYRLMSHVKVTEVPRTHLVKAVLWADEPAGMDTMLNAVMEAFVDKLRVEQESQNIRRLEYLQRERDTIVTRIEAERKRLLELAGTVPNKAFLHENYSVHLSKLEQIQRLYWEAAVISAEKQSLLEKALHDRDRLKELSLQPFADERVADNFGINRIEQWTYEQLQVMRTSIDGLTVDNPDRKYVEERMKAMNDFLADYKKDVNNSTIRNLVSKRDFELNTDVLKAETVAQASKESETLLGDQLEQARKEASDVSETIFRAADIDFSVVQLRERLAALNTRIDDCEMEAKAPVRIAIDKRAERPTTPARSRSRTLIMLAAFLAYGGLAGIFLVFDLLDNRIRCFRQVEQALGGPGPDPVASYVSAVPCQQEFSHVLQVNPGHPAAKAIRDLAVRLNYERERHGARVFVFSGLGPGCGTSTLALNAAQALATLCGRTLLIEMNISRPGLAQWIAPLQPSRFSEDVIATPGDLGACTLHDLERGVDVLPARGGPGGVNLTGLGEMLSFARSSYAAVLLDVGPVFSDDLAHHVLLHADAAVLVAREDVSLYADLRRAIVMLTRADIPALTGVLNFSQHRPDGWLRKVTQTKLGGMSRLHERFNVWRLKLVARWRKSAAGKDV